MPHDKNNNHQGFNEWRQRTLAVCVEEQGKLQDIARRLEQMAVVSSDPEPHPEEPIATSPSFS